MQHKADANFHKRNSLTHLNLIFTKLIAGFGKQGPPSDCQAVPGEIPMFKFKIIT